MKYLFLIGAWLMSILIYLSIIVAVIYVAVHFIRKLW